MTLCHQCPWLSEGGCTAARCVTPTAIDQKMGELQRQFIAGTITSAQGWSEYQALVTKRRNGLVRLRCVKEGKR